jgi:hypothetical protein
MGLISGLLGLPLAPVRGVVWVSEQLLEAARAELYDEGKIRARLSEIELQHELGEISSEEYERAEEELLERLETARELKDMTPSEGGGITYYGDAAGDQGN